MAIGEGNITWSDKLNRRAAGSTYMQWVKTETQAAFNLANSGLKAYPLSALSVDFDGLTLSGPGAYGYLPLREAIAGKCGVHPDCVATAQGTSMANYLVMAALLEPGDEVLIEHPLYSLLAETASYAGGQVRVFRRRPENNYAVDAMEVAAELTPRTKLIVLTNLHNPSCAFTPERVLREIAEVAKRAGARLMVDEVYLDLLFERTPPTAFQLDPEIIVTSSLTKVYGLSGLRCGWIVAEPELVRRVYGINDLLYVNAPYITDQISCIALKNLTQIRHWSQTLLEKNQAIATQFLHATPELVSENAGPGTVLFLRTQVPAEALCRVLKEKYETVITPGRFFDMPDHVRVGIGGETAILAEGLSRVHAAVRELVG
jgi:aspartate/methionine/tyrosine aminotransferase